MKSMIFLKVAENISFEKNAKGNKCTRALLIFKKFSNNTFLLCLLKITRYEKKNLSDCLMCNFLPFKEKHHARVIFKDRSFKDTNVKTNPIQVLKQFDIDEIVSV